MRRLLLVCLVVLGLVAIPTTTDAQTSPARRYPHMSAEDAGQTGDRIGTAGVGRLANAYAQRNFADAPAGRTYTLLESRFTVEQTNNDIGYFYATSTYFQGRPQEVQAYAGLQTRLCVPTAAGGCTYNQRGVIFSIFGGYGAAAPPGGYVASGTEVGLTFYSIRVPYNWVVGHTYQVRIEHLAGDPADHWHSWVKDLNTNGFVDLGKIAVGNTLAGLDFPNQWTEFYYPADPPSCAVPQSRSLWEQPKMLVSPTDGIAHFAFSTDRYIDPNTQCQNSASIGGCCQLVRELIAAIV